MEYLKDVLNILCMLKGLPKWNELFIIILEIILNRIIRGFSSKHDRFLNYTY